MIEITLYSQNRFGPVALLPAEQKKQLKACLLDCLSGQSNQGDLEESVAAAMDSRVCDLEDLVTIHYVDGNRDLSRISPIPPCDYLVCYNRQDFQPILDALKAGDFELAATLTPQKYRLIGYQELKESKRLEEQGQGWAGQYSVTEIPPGVYPVFTRNFAYHGAKGCFTNYLKDYDGITTWLEGECIQSSDIPSEDLPYTRVTFGSLYSHAVAHAILEGQCSITLIPPFAAMEVPFEYYGERLVTYRIVDTSLPPFLKENPITLRTEEQRRAVFREEQRINHRSSGHRPEPER